MITIDTHNFLFHLYLLVEVSAAKLGHWPYDSHVGSLETHQRAKYFFLKIFRLAEICRKY